MRSVFVLGAFVLLAACSQRLLTALPAGDGAGPVGGAGEGSGAPTAPPTAPTSPTGTGSTSPSSTDDAGLGDDAGSYPSGLDAGPVSSLDADTIPDASEGGSAFDAAPGAGDAGSVTELLADCVSTINGVRAQNEVAPYAESTELESYAALAAASDAHNGQKHAYFYATGGGGVAATEDELDGDQVNPGGSAEETFELGLQGDVQGQGQAFANLVSTQFAQVGCGFAQDAAGNWWIDMAMR